MQYILSFMLRNLLELTYLQKDTVHLHVLEGITQTVVIGSATNATKEAVTRTILANLTCSGGNYNQCTACNSGSFLYLNWRILANLAPIMDRGTTPVRLVQQEEEAATVSDSCNPGTFLYLSQCLNPCTTTGYLLGRYLNIHLPTLLQQWIGALIHLCDMFSRRRKQQLWLIHVIH